MGLNCIHPNPNANIGPDIEPLVGEAYARYHCYTIVFKPLFSCFLLLAVEPQRSLHTVPETFGTSPDALGPVCAAPRHHVWHNPCCRQNGWVRKRMSSLVEGQLMDLLEEPPQKSCPLSLTLISHNWATRTRPQPPSVRRVFEPQSGSDLILNRCGALRRAWKASQPTSSSGAQPKLTSRHPSPLA